MTMVVVLGPTAVGKSSFGINLCQAIGGEVVNADALQVYRGFDIGTAKPSVEQRATVPHHLLDILSPTDTFSAGEFARRAKDSVQEIRSRGKVPVVVGGSGLYLRALYGHLCEIPKVSADLRTSLEARLAERGLEFMLHELFRVDPELASLLSPQDTQRILRGLEVYWGTGRGLSWWWKQQQTQPVWLDRIELGLTVPRAILYDLIAVRVRQMVERGWLEEVSNLLEQGIPPTASAFQAIGYRQLVEVASGKSALSEAVEMTIRSTCRYAKRQETWFRRERNVFWIQGPRAEATIPFVLQELNRRGAFAQ